MGHPLPTILHPCHLLLAVLDFGLREMNFSLFPTNSLPTWLIPKQLTRLTLIIHRITMDSRSRRLKSLKLFRLIIISKLPRIINLLLIREIATLRSCNVPIAPTFLKHIYFYYIFYLLL